MAELEEWSTNFDSDHVETFLRRISPRIDSGFGDAEIAQIVRLISDMDVDQQEELIFKLLHDGQPSDFRISAFMDDIDSPDLYFFAQPLLCKQLSDEMTKSCEEMGM